MSTIKFSYILDELNFYMVGSYTKFLLTVILEAGDTLADRCQALAYAIRDQLQIQYEVGTK